MWYKLAMASLIYRKETFTESPLLIKSKEFALYIIKICNIVKREKKESVLTNQLIRSGTSIGANIREAFYGHGKADFIARYRCPFILQKALFYALFGCVPIIY